MNDPREGSHVASGQNAAYFTYVPAARRVMEMDESLAEAQASLGILKTHRDWDWPGAEREFQRAIELNPEYGAAHSAYAYQLLAVGRLSAALAEARRAREADPLSPMISASVGDLYHYSRQYEQAVQESRKAIEMDHALAFSHRVLGTTYALQRRHKEAAAELEQALHISRRGLLLLAYAGTGFAFLGQREEAQKLLTELLDLSKQRYVASDLPAMIYATLGEGDRAFEYFEKALQERSLPPWYLRDPLLDGVRSDSRFQSLLQRMGLPP